MRRREALNRTTRIALAVTLGAAALVAGVTPKPARAAKAYANVGLRGPSVRLGPLRFNSGVKMGRSVNTKKKHKKKK